jgi:hypothetical protein
MTRTVLGVCAAGLLGLAVVGMVEPPRAAAANYGGRQYYGGWSYNEINSYYYRTYYYRPAVTTVTYSYHYVVYYPSRPRYYYYYNPVRRYYWGRYDTEAKGYSLLAEADRKEKLEDIKESAFPKPAVMPNVPDSADKVAMDVPPNDVPTGGPEKK